MAKSVATKTVKVRTKKENPLKLKDAKRKRDVKKLTTADIATLPARSSFVTAEVLDRLWTVVMSRRNADPAISHSARLLSRGTAKVAQKFGEEAVECLIEATSGTHEGLVGESADVLYHLIVMWVNAGLHPEEVWAELKRREGISGVAEKAARPRAMPLARRLGTRKIP
jgi:phosphoribosyl-ATP pyrophosphohydrolase